MFEKIIATANQLDQKGLYKEADLVIKYMIKKAQEGNFEDKIDPNLINSIEEPGGELSQYDIAASDLGQDMWRLIVRAYRHNLHQDSREFREYTEMAVENFANQVEYTMKMPISYGLKWAFKIVSKLLQRMNSNPQTMNAQDRWEQLAMQAARDIYRSENAV